MSSVGATGRWHSLRCSDFPADVHTRPTPLARVGRELLDLELRTYLAGSSLGRSCRSMPWRLSVGKHEQDPLYQYRRDAIERVEPDFLRAILARDPRSTPFIGCFEPHNTCLDFQETKV